MLFKARRLNRIKRMSTERNSKDGTWSTPIFRGNRKEEEPVKETGSGPWGEERTKREYSQGEKKGRHFCQILHRSSKMRTYS